MYRLTYIVLTLLSGCDVTGSKHFCWDRGYQGYSYLENACVDENFRHHSIEKLKYLEEKDHVQAK